MARDLNKAIEEGHRIANKRRGLTLTLREVNDLYQRFYRAISQEDSNALLDIIDASYHAGLAVGYRNATKNAVSREGDQDEI